MPKVFRLSIAGRTGQTCTAPFPFILGVLPIAVSTGAGIGVKAFFPIKAIALSADETMTYS